jgi:hypothetical protein
MVPFFTVIQEGLSTWGMNGDLTVISKDSPSALAVRDDALSVTALGAGVGSGVGVGSSLVPQEQKAIIIAANGRKQFFRYFINVFV